MTKPKNGTASKRYVRCYPRHDWQTTTEAYIQAFCRMNGHIPATYIVNGKEVKA